MSKVTTDEETAEIKEAVRSGRVTFEEGWNRSKAPTSSEDNECPRCGMYALLDFDHSVACLACTYILAMHD